MPDPVQTSRLLERQVNVLEMIARDATLDDVLDEICRLAESFAPGGMAGVTVLDRGGMTFEHCVMPSAPTFAAGIPGVEVGPPHAGTCAAAVFGGAPVSSSDVENDERFDPLWRKLNTDHGVRAIRSRPVCSADGRALGSFFIAYKDGAPDPWPEEIEAIGARLSGLALDRHRATERQKLIVGEMQHRLKNLFAAVLSIAVADVAGRRHDRGIPESLRRPCPGARQRPRPADARRIGRPCRAHAPHRGAVRGR